MGQKAEKDISHYKILSEIGRGGMGEVYLAQDTTLGRKVAVKIISDEYCEDSDRLRRFVQEAKTASALNHPNIITVFEFGKHNDTHFMATEFIEGKELSRLIVEEDISLRTVLEIAIQIASALETAHSTGIIHRDIKPDNVMVRADGIVKVLDFGLAKLSHSHGKSENNDFAATREKILTDPGRILGTPNYMSPEQVRGKRVDTRTDIWSLGILLYEMIAGKVPFTGETVSDVIAAILSKELKRSSKFDGKYKSKLFSIIGKALQKNAENRFKSVSKMSDELKELKKRLLFDEELEKSEPPEEPTFTEALTKSHSNEPVESISADGVKDSLVLTEFNNLTGDVVFDGTLKMALAFTLEQSPFIKIFSDTKVRETLGLMGQPTDKTISCKIAKEVCQRQGLKAFIAGSISRLGSNYVLTLEAINAKTDEIIGRQLEQAESKEDVLKVLGTLASGMREQLGESLSSIEKFDAPLELTTSSLEALQVLTHGYDHYLQGRNLDAIPFYKRAVEIDPDFAYAYLELSALHYNTDQPKEAIEYIKRGYELRDRVSEFEKIRITVFYNSHVTGDQKKALDALSIHKKTYPNDYRAYAFLADRYIFLGQFEKAVKESRKCILLNPKALVGYWNLTQSLIGLNRFDEAKQVCRQSLDEDFAENIWAYRFLYQIALIENDEIGMKDFLPQMKDSSYEHLSLNLRAIASSSRGQIEKSEEFTRRAIDSAVRIESKGVAARLYAEQALRMIFWKTNVEDWVIDESLKSSIADLANHALELESNKLTVPFVALVYCLLGKESEGKQLINEITSEFPKDTLLNELWLPTISAIADLRNENPGSAIEQLEITERYERVGEFYPQFFRGLAFLALGKPSKSVAEFDKITQNRGQAPYSILHVFAQYQRAKITKSRREYEKFFDMFVEADENIPVITRARSEFVSLK